MDNGLSREDITETDEWEQLQETQEQLGELLDEMEHEQSMKQGASLHTCSPEEVAYADELVGSLIISTLGTVTLVTGYYASARRSNGSDGEYGAEVVVEGETLATGDNEHATVGDTHGWFVGKFEYGVATTIYGVPDTGCPNPDEWERFNFKTSSWRVTDAAKQIRDNLHNSDYDDKITGGRNNR